MNPEHQKKVDELIQIILADLRSTARRLYHSGGINARDYNKDKYILAKILISVAMKEHVNDFYPLAPDLKKIARNLECF